MPSPKPSKTYKLYPFQRHAWESKARYVALCGGTGGGKTYFGPLWLTNKIAQDQVQGTANGARYLALAPTVEMARDLLAPTLRKHYQGTALEGEYLIQANTYTLPTGGVVYFRSADKPERIEGHHVNAAWVDEPGQMKALIWPIIQARTGFHKAQVLFTGYPWDMGWYYGEIFKKWEQGDPDYDVIRFRSTDNPEYPKTEYERAKRTLPPWLFEMRYEGQFRKPMGLVYPEFGMNLFCDPFPIPAGWPVFVGLDPGVFFGALFLAWQDGTWYAFSDYYCETVRPAHEHAQELLSRKEGLVQGWVYDPARITDVTDLAPYGIGPLVQGSNPVLAGISTATGVIRTGRLKVMRGRCPNFVDQMEKYSFPTDTSTGNVARENPIKKDDHLPDCFRYVVHTVEGTRVEEEKALVVYDDAEDISPY